MKKKIFCDIDNTIADHYSHYQKCLKTNKKLNLLDLKRIKNSKSFFNFSQSLRYISLLVKKK